MQYLGGKAKIAKQIAEVINRFDYDVFVEPFVGGCNIIQHLPKDKPKYLSDSNLSLVMFYAALANGWEPPKDVSEERYKELKDTSQYAATAEAGFVGIACSYSGKWFGGYARDGKGRNYALNGYNSAMKLKPYLATALIMSAKYDELPMADLPAKCLIYCDPPYKGTTGYVGVFEHDKFWQWVRDNSAKATILVSEYEAPEDFECIWQLERNLEMKSSAKAKPTKRIEKIFKYKG